MAIDKINCVLKFKPQNEVFYDCYITIGVSEYWLIIVGNYRILSRRAHDWNDSSKYKIASDFEVLTATIGNKDVSVNLENSIILDIIVESNKMCLRLDSISYNTKLRNAYLLSPSSKCMRKYLSNGLFCTTYNNTDFFFSYDADYECIRVTSSERDIEKEEKTLASLLGLISFYLRTPVEIWIRETITDNKSEKHFSKLKYCAVMEMKEGNNISYIRVNGDYLELSDFLNGCYYLQNDENKRKIVNRGIERYIASTYLDDITKFVYLVSIIHTFAEKVYGLQGKASKQVNQLLDMFHIDSSIMNDGVVFTSVREKSENHFVEVRNEILHALPSKEIEELIEETELIRKVDFCALILILNELGFSDIKFCEDFKSLNILKI